MAWLRQRSSLAGDGLVTHSRELTEGLRRRGIEVLFFHHEAGVGDGVEMQALAISRGFRISRPGSRRRLGDALRSGRVDLVHVSLSFPSLGWAIVVTIRPFLLEVYDRRLAALDQLAPWAIRRPSRERLALSTSPTISLRVR